MKIKTNENGQVDFTLLTGNEKVKGTMLASEALTLVHDGEVKKQGNTFIVNEKFVFEIDDDPEMSDMPEYELKEEVEPIAEDPEEDPEDLDEEMEEDRPLSKTSKRAKRKNG